MAVRAKAVVDRGLQAVGLEVRRVRAPERRIPPPLCDTVWEAMYENREAFRCPVSNIVFKNGLSTASDGWNPFTALMEQVGRGHASYDGSVLAHYYDRWQPAHALEALLFESHTPRALARAPAHVLLTPWSRKDLHETRRFIEDTFAQQVEEVVGVRVGIEEGYKYHGPVSRRVAEVEFKRCVDVYRSIATHGYLRTLGDVGVRVLRRGMDVRMLPVGGHHRVAAMAALGESEVPARFHSRAIIDIRDVDHWAQVRRGIWDRGSALAYFNHLFDFDSKAWAREQGLLAAEDERDAMGQSSDKTRHYNNVA